MDMVPMECVVRGYFYGSLVKRWKDGSVAVPEGTQTELAARLPEPIFDPTTKSEHDLPVTEEDALGTGLVTREQFAWLSSKSIEIFKRMTPIADSAGFILADLKLEFGFDGGEIVLGDSIGPDEYRLWPKDQHAVGRTQESYDKQILRDWLSEHGYAKQFEASRDEGREPVAPPIPGHIVEKMTQRYVEAYRQITGLSL